MTWCLFATVSASEHDGQLVRQAVAGENSAKGSCEPVGSFDESKARGWTEDSVSDKSTLDNADATVK